MADTRLQIGGDSVVVDDVTKGTTFDLVNRDPDQINANVTVAFEEIFAEPHPAVFSFDSVWKTSFKVFRNTKLWCYRISTLLCAVPASICWGIYFAQVACCTIWCCRPCIKAYEINLGCFKGCLLAMLDACCRPCYESCGYLFYNIRINMVKE